MSRACEDVGHLAEDDALPVLEYLERSEDGERLVKLCEPCAEELRECGAVLVPMQPLEPAVTRWRDGRGRIVIAGWPRSGKTILSQRLEAAGLQVHHTDFLKDSHTWSGASDEIALWLGEPGPWICEGVAAIRGLRKRLAADTGRPCDLLVWCRRSEDGLLPGQRSMGRGAETILSGILPELRRRGVEFLVV